jgi:hypothetical protein
LRSSVILALPIVSHSELLSLIWHLACNASVTAHLQKAGWRASLFHRRLK